MKIKYSMKISVGQEMKEAVFCVGPNKYTHIALVIVVIYKYNKIIHFFLSIYVCHFFMQLLSW